MNNRLLRTSVKNWLFSLLVIAGSLASAEAYAQDGVAGQVTFKQNCKTCHKIDGKSTGPGLRDVLSRIPEGDWFDKWVKNSSEVIASGDAYGGKIFAEYKTTMTAFPLLSADDLANLKAYLGDPDKYAPPSKDPSGGGETGPAPVEENNKTLYWMLTLGVVFYIVISVLLGVRRSLQNLVNEKNGLPPVEDLTHWQSIKAWMGRNTTISAVVIIAFILAMTVNGMEGLMGIGVYQGYEPEQPINFSHKIHAGDMDINCRYCHHSAEKGKTSGIPSVNVCMNCHKAITGKDAVAEGEIDKIYDAAGWNKDKMEYDGPEKPIEWIKVHNLPDFVYFNHSQHVVAGEQECQTCHGPVETMDVVEQHSDLTMRWCIDCHRETAVAMDGNGYYDELHAQLKAKYAAEGKTSFTVNDIGGIECAKCHY